MLERKGFLFEFLFVCAFLLFFIPATSNAANLDTLINVEHGGTAIVDGETINRADLLNTFQTWTFNFTWPTAVSNSRSFFGVFRGTFGDLEGGTPVAGTNYASTNQSWPSTNPKSISKSFSLPALGDLNTPSGDYTAVVAEIDSSHAEVALWFASGGVEGVEPTNYALLTFTYDAHSQAENLNSLHFVEHGGLSVLDGDTTNIDDFSVDSDFWTFNFDWPHAVANQAALFAVFRGTFGNVENGNGAQRNLQYDYNLQSWPASNPKSITKHIGIPTLASGNASSHTYSVLVAERDPKYLDPNQGFSPEDQMQWFISGGADGIPPLRYSVLQFDYNDEVIDPLILQYEPILYLHPDENYRPMNVEAFIGASALWDDRDILSDVKLKERGDVTVDDIANPNSEDWYLAFSGDTAKSFDPIVAKSRYNQLVSDGDAKTTYYAYKTTDSYTDSEGVVHEFIVLQYWYFYAFNDWKEHSGTNNHEGDWESVFVFLDAATQEPKYIAYSAHLNDGNPNDNPIFQYDSVRRTWDSIDVQRDGDHTKSFVALGSHANYSNNGNNGVHDARLADDHTSTVGIHLENNDWVFKKEIFNSIPTWMNYAGKWGTDSIDATEGKSGPQGPKFIAPFLGGGVARFQQPVEWAGINDIATQVTSESTNNLTFPDQGVDMSFLFPIQAGTEVTVSPHNENISFGNNVDSISFTPHFWEFDSNLVNNTFETTVSIAYDQDEIDALDLDESKLKVFYYDEVLDRWESVGSIAEVVSNTISFITSHFSRYAIGVEKPRTSEELYEDIISTIESLVLADDKKQILILSVNTVKRLEEGEQPRKRQRISTRLNRLVRSIELMVENGEITEPIGDLLQDIEELRQLLLNS